MSLEDLKSRSDLSLDEILQLMKVETNVKIYAKLTYFKFQAMGYSKVESYKLASIKKSTAYYLEDLWHAGGYNALLQKSGQGRKTKINEDQMIELGNILKTKDIWVVNDVIELIEEKWGVDYTYNGVHNLLNTHFDVKIDNDYSAMRKKKKDVVNVVQNFDSIDPEEIAEIELIISHIEDEKHFNVLKRLFYLLFKKIGFSTDVTSHFLSITSSTGNNWSKRWEEEGYEGLLHKKGQGRKPKLSD